MNQPRQRMRPLTTSYSNLNLLRDEHSFGNIQRDAWHYIYESAWMVIILVESNAEQTMRLIKRG